MAALALLIAVTTVAATKQVKRAGDAAVRHELRAKMMNDPVNRSVLKDLKKVKGKFKFGSQEPADPVGLTPATQQPTADERAFQFINPATSAPFSAPRRISESGATVYGFLSTCLSTDFTTDYTNEVRGLVELSSDGTYNCIYNSPTTLPDGMTADDQYVYEKDGKFHLIINGNYMVQHYTTWEYVVDKEGNLISAEALDGNPYRFFVYNPEDDMIYGLIEKDHERTFAKSPEGSLSGYTVIATNEETYSTQSLTLNQVTGQIIGTTAYGEVYEINKEDGSVKILANLSHPTLFPSGFCYSPMDGGYMYVITSFYENTVDILDPETFAVKKSAPLDRLMQFWGLCCTDTKGVDPSAPGKAEFLGSNFDDGSTTGTLTYKMSSVTDDGTPVLGNITWVLSIDGNEYKRGSAAAGSEVEIGVADLEENTHSFRLDCYLGGLQGRPRVNSLYVGNDMPKTPQNVTITENAISWDPVTEGIHDGYLVPEEVTYTVTLNDDVLATDYKSSSLQINLPQGAELDTYTATVVAKFRGKYSDIGTSNDLYYGDAFNLPVNFEPDDKNNKYFTIEDVNGDDYTFQYTLGTAGSTLIRAFCYMTNRKDGDDWLYLPAVQFPSTDKLYEFSLNTFRIYNFDETFEIALFSEPNEDSKIATLKEEDVIKDVISDYTYTNWKEYAYFKVPKPGAYYIGIHATTPNTPSSGYAAFFRDFTVQESDVITSDSPGAVTNLSAECAPKGELWANVTFTFPTKNVVGEDLNTGEALKAVLHSSTGAESTVEGIPGKTVTAKVDTRQGYNYVEVQVFDGDLPGATNRVIIYTGLVAPGEVQNLKLDADETNNVLLMTWDAPNEENGSDYCGSTDITYYYAQKVTYTPANVIQYYVPAIGVDVYSAERQFDLSSLLQIKAGVLTENSIGMASSSNLKYIVLGTPYNLPLESNYITGDIVEEVYSGSTDVLLFVDDPYWDYDNFETEDELTALYTYSYGDIEDGVISLPKFSTKNVNKASVDMHVWGGSCSQFSIYASTTGVPEELIETYSVDKGNLEEGPDATLSITLPEKFQNKGWVEITIHFDAAEDESFILYSYKFYDKHDYNFALTALEGEKAARMGEVSNYVAHIYNSGAQARNFPGGKWTLESADGEVLASVVVKPGEELVEPNGELTFPLSFTATADYSDNLKLTFAINDGDENSLDNSQTMDIQVVRGSAAVVNDLHADEVSYDNVALGWTAPTTNVIADEGFEDCTPLVLDYKDDMLGDFHREDVDGLPSVGFNKTEYKKLPICNRPFSFVVWSEEQMTPIWGDNAEYVKAHSGDKYIVALRPIPTDEGIYPQADDWLISPQVKGGSDFSFFIRPIDYLYGPEYVEVLVSKTTDATDAFEKIADIKLEGSSNQVPVWEQFVYTLADDVKYFAIRYVSAAKLGIEIDDIAYVPADQEALPISGYNVYRNGEVIADNELCGDATYNDGTVAQDKAYSYVVVPVLSDGTRGLDSNTLRVRTTGIDSLSMGSKAIYFKAGKVYVKGYTDEPVEIAATDGRLIAGTAKATDEWSHPVAPGIYIVKAGSDIVKLFAR